MKFLPFLLGLFSLSCSLRAQNVKNRLHCADVVYFQSASAALRNSEHAALLRIKNCLEQHPKATALIAAHTDTIGSYESNEQLARERAQSVTRYLLEIGIDSQRLDVRAFGEYSPIKLEGDAQSQALNRRVTILVQEPYLEDPNLLHCSVQGEVVDGQTQQKLLAQLDAYYLGGQDSTQSDSFGRYDFRLPRKTRIELRAKVKGYFFVSKLINLDSVASPYVLNFNLERARIGEKMALQDLFFMPGKPVLLPSSERALAGLVEFLQFNSELKLEIGGHINRSGPAVSEQSPSFQLSLQRAKAVYDYLLEQGIASNRLQYRGYGNLEMIYAEPQSNLEEQLNRRVEIKVLSQ